jgi:hypothetical protein
MTICVSCTVNFREIDSTPKRNHNTTSLCCIRFVCSGLLLSSHATQRNNPLGLIAPDGGVYSNDTDFAALLFGDDGREVGIGGSSSWCFACHAVDNEQARG